MLLTEQDLYTHLYEEIINEIKRGDDDLPEICIAMAEEEAKAYLFRYDLDKLFGDTNGNAPEVNSELLKSKVKDIACWVLIRKANPNAFYEMYKEAYESSIAFLRTVMNGKASPDGWPLRSAGESTDAGASILYTSNPQRGNHF